MNEEYQKHISDDRLKNQICKEHNCGVVWYDSGQTEIRFWKVCEKYHHAFNGETEYKEIFPKLIQAHY